MPTANNISIHINLAGISGRIQRILDKTIKMVAIGLNTKKELSEQRLEIPDINMHYLFSTSQPWTNNEMWDAWHAWILRNGFRDIAETLNGLLEEIQQVLAYWELAHPQQTIKIRSEDWNEKIVRRANQFHRRTLPQKLDILERQYSFTLDPILLSQAISINNARNCLTHRGGIVSSVDVDATGQFTLEWSALVLLTKINGQEQEITLPYETKVETEVTIATRRKTKTFNVGQLISVTTEEFSQLCWTIYQLSVSCGQRLELYGKDRGFKFKNPLA